LIGRPRAPRHPHRKPDRADVERLAELPGKMCDKSHFGVRGFAEAIQNTSSVFRQRSRVDLMQPLLVVRAKNFRSLRDVEIELQPLNVLVGPNASGKSNFLDLIAFLGDAVREDLRPALAKRGGFERVHFRGKTTSVVEITIEARVTKHANDNARDVYTLRFSEGGTFESDSKRILSRAEVFTFKRTKGSGRRLTINGRRFTIYDRAKDALKLTQRSSENLLQQESLGLSTLPRLAPDRGGEQVSKLAELFSTFRVFDVNVHAARRPSPARRGARLQSDASNLAAFLHELSVDKSMFHALVEDARAMIPGLKQIHFRTIGGAEEAVAVELEEQGLRNRTPLADASYGSIRALALLAMLYDPDPPLLTCVEEIDHGLHPYVFDRLVELLREASTRTQFLVVTHSPALVNRLNASELIVVERDHATGETRMPAIDPAEVQKMEQALAGKMGLGELWFSGTLGGNP
jgi:predicted ATPase